MLAKPIHYSNIQATGGKMPRFHLGLMILLTKLITPIGRIRGLGIVTHIISRIARINDVYAEVSLNPSTRFSFPVYDAYWSYFIHKNLLYEQALVHFLYAISKLQFIFIDCGANYGYWSAIMSSPEFGSHKSLAIEASKESTVVLEKTCSLNNHRFQILHGAVYNESGKKIQFTEGGRQAGRHIIDGTIEKLKVNFKGLFSPAEIIQAVETITLSDVILKYFPTDKSIIIKLDVEGAEMQCLIGAEEIQDRDILFIYEDFGGDDQSEITRYLLQKLYLVYYPDDMGGIMRIRDISQLAKIKSDQRSGYNFIAVKNNSKFTEYIQQYSS